MIRAQFLPALDIWAIQTQRDGADQAADDEPRRAPRVASVQTWEAVRSAVVRMYLVLIGARSSRSR